MDDFDAYLRDEENSLEDFEEQDISRVSATVRSLVEEQSECELNYEEFLHLEVRIDENRNKVLKCNLGITECITYININQVQVKSSLQAESLPAKISKEAKSTKQKWLQETRNSLQTFKKVLTIREVQMTMILFILQYHSKSNFKQLYSKNFGEIMQFMIPQQDCHQKINTFILDDLFKKQLQELTDFLELISNLKHSYEYLLEQTYNEETQGIAEKMMNKMKITNSKIRTISEIFPFACIKDINDLFSVNQLHERWQDLRKQSRIIYIHLSDKLTLERSFLEIKENLNVINAAMSIMDRRKMLGNESLNNKMKTFYESSIKILKCALNKKEAKFEAEIMFSEGKDDLAKEIWNLPENKKFREFIQLCLPSIAYSAMFYLPRVYKGYFFQQFSSLQSVSPPSIQIEDFAHYREDLLVKKPYEESIRIRINYNKKLQPRNQNAKGSPKNKDTGRNSFFESVTKLFKSEEKAPKAVIFHIHGGGFISMSSFIHQTYTRRWANNLNVPIVSVDYGKAPSRPYPEGLYDCLEAYMWTVNVFTQLFQGIPDKIILVGDSAGGNLVAALTNLLIKWKLPKPAGIVLAYPALNLNLNNYTPSLLTALNDMILPHTFLKVCANAYLGKHRQQASSNPLISPILTQDDVLAQYPPTQIFVGNKDPFHDDCCRFIERLSELNSQENQLSILDQFPHGFLQFDLKLMPNQYSRQATRLVQKALERLINQ